MEQVGGRKWQAILLRQFAAEERIKVLKAGGANEKGKDEKPKKGWNGGTLSPVDTEVVADVSSNYEVLPSV